MKTLRPILMRAFLFLLFAAPCWAQESIEVPQILQQNVHAFNLTMDSLGTLTADLYSLAEASALELDGIRQKLALTPAGTRTYLLERRRFEERYAAFLAQKYHTLADMQALRQQTLSHLEGILDRMQKGDSSGARQVRESIRAEIRANDDRLARTRIDLLQLISKLKKPDLPVEERRKLSQRVQRLRNDQLALYRTNQNRLAALLETTGQQNEDWPAMQNSLRTMWENLQSGFAWIDAEMAYTRLFADYRKNWLAVDAQLLEVTGLVERFRDAVQRMNASGGLLQQMDDLGKILHPETNGRLLLPDVPALQWPGQPLDKLDDRELSAAEIDSLERELKKP